jgi:hypothetical protein
MAYLQQDLEHAPFNRTKPARALSWRLAVGHENPMLSLDA